MHWHLFSIKKKKHVWFNYLSFLQKQYLNVFKPLVLMISSDSIGSKCDFIIFANIFCDIWITLCITEVITLLCELWVDFVTGSHEVITYRLLLLIMITDVMRDKKRNSYQLAESSLKVVIIITMDSLVRFLKYRKEVWTVIVFFPVVKLSNSIQLYFSRE